MLINHQHYRTLWALDAADAVQKSVAIIDQTQLPHAFEVVKIDTLAGMVEAIKTMQVRGAPLIGAAAAYGMALATHVGVDDQHLKLAAETLILSRPTAVNLQWAVNRMLAVLLNAPTALRQHLAWLEAAKICDEDVEINRQIGAHGLDLIAQIHHMKLAKGEQYSTNKSAVLAGDSNRVNVLTHCNAGWLATVDGGTALAPIYAAFDAGIPVHVWVDETRPRNQGASLTAWELAQHGVPYTVISDNAGGHLMQHGLVDMVMVGADRVTATGDVCNKIGTYLKALAAFDNVVNGQRIPFYAAVPSPTIDWAINDGVHEIEIENRHGDELACMRGILANGEVAEVRLMPIHTPIANPAFDVTPARLVTGILTEHGLLAPGQLTALRSNFVAQPKHE